MERDYKVLWIETICTDQELIEKNILKVKVQSADYTGWEDREKAADDFRNRIKAYEKEYSILSEESDGKDTSYIQLIDNNTEIKMRNIVGELQSKIFAYLLNLHTLERPIYFIPAGQSNNDANNILGGESDITDEGIKYAQCINNFFKEKIKDLNQFPEECKLLCSTNKRSVLQTVKEMTSFTNVMKIKILEEINFGYQDNKTEEQFFKEYPGEEEEMKKDRLNYRYPRGESYRDLIGRTERIIVEIERHCGPIVLVLKPSVMKVLYGYFAYEAEVKEIVNIPNIEIPKDTIIEFTPEAYGFRKELYNIDTRAGFRKLSTTFLRDMSLYFNPYKSNLTTDSLKRNVSDIYDINEAQKFNNKKFEIQEYTNYII